MNIFEAIFLGIIQGLTEFLPISSTGHLTVAGKLMHLVSAQHPERWTSFIAVIQLGTLLAVVIFFWNDLWKILTDFLKQNIVSREKFSQQSLNSKMGWYIIIGSLPVAIIGFGFQNIIEGALTKNLFIISASLIVFALILAVSEKVGTFNKGLKEMNWKSALLIGIAQTFALIPGSSRSGTTITMGLFCGYKRETAARFSFLLSVPAVLGSGLLQFYESLHYLNAAVTFNLIIATLSAAISGYLAIGLLLRYLRTNTTYVFVFYRIIIGLSILTLIWTSIIHP